MVARDSLGLGIEGTTEPLGGGGRGVGGERGVGRRQPVNSNALSEARECPQGDENKASYHSARALVFVADWIDAERLLRTR